MEDAFSDGIKVQNVVDRQAVPLVDKNGMELSFSLFLVEVLHAIDELADIADDHVWIKLVAGTGTFNEDRNRLESVG